MNLATPTSTDSQLHVAWAAIGLAPISALAISLLELIPLHVGGPLLIAVASSAATVLQTSRPAGGRIVVGGLFSGLCAVLLYDCTRLPFVLIGDWPDFIPRIGSWLLEEPDAHWTVGYLWRYLGNGAGMGLTFTALVPFADPWVSRRWAGVLFGVAIWTGLIATLLMAPAGEEKMFALTPTTVALSLAGHFVYGGVLGLLAARTKSTPGPTEIR